MASGGSLTNWGIAGYASGRDGLKTSHDSKNLYAATLLPERRDRPTMARLHIAPVYPQILHFEVGQRARSPRVVLGWPRFLQRILIIS